MSLWDATNRAENHSSWILFHYYCVITVLAYFYYYQFYYTTSTNVSFSKVDLFVFYALQSDYITFFWCVYICLYTHTHTLTHIYECLCGQFYQARLLVYKSHTVEYRLANAQLPF